MKIVVKLIVFLSLIISSVAAQNETVTVPDLIGLSMPEAAGALGRAGLKFGSERIIAVDAASDDRENTVAEQTPNAGELAETGSIVDVGVLRMINAYVIYDDNDLTLVNMAADLLDLTQITFEAIDTAQAIEFSASAWSPTLEQGRCGQVWSLARISSKEIEGCSLILWMTANDRSQHFWTSTAGVERFRILQEDTERAQCAAATPESQNAPLRCDIVFDIVYPGENIDYIYIAYTPDVLIIRNQTQDRWMDFSETVLRDSRSRDIDLSALDIFVGEDIVPARLAPGQCVLFGQGGDQQPPEPCDLVGQINVDPSELFWNQPFRVIGRDDYPRVCEAASQGELMICVMPR